MNIGVPQMNGRIPTGVVVTNQNGITDKRAHQNDYHITNAKKNHRTVPEMTASNDRKRTNLHDSA